MKKVGNMCVLENIQGALTEERQGGSVEGTEGNHGILLSLFVCLFVSLV